MSESRIIVGDCLEVLRGMPDESVHCCVTSPPYFGLRDYGHDGQIGLEETPEAYAAKLVEVFREVRRVLRVDGTCWLNLGDSYNNFRVSTNGQAVHGRKLNGKFEGRRPVDHNLKEKDLIGIPWRVAFALQADGWWLRQDIIWSKPNPMPESVTDRCTKAHEYVFLMTKAARYWYDAEAVKEAVTPGCYRGPRRNGFKEDGATHNKNDSGVHCGSDPESGRNRRSVWTVATQPYAEAHFATYPPDLIKPMILAGCPVGGTVLDPFGGSGTTGMVALELGRSAILIELNPEYAKLAERRTNVTPGLAF